MKLIIALRFLLEIVIIIGVGYGGFNLGSSVLKCTL